ncbi:pseudouridine synthase [Hirschia litorea]|uniref:Pseudouridine synthase n=1 Tax=Hirschia litorea TaxID=1199156 RepID=A0ABW2ILZ4_9PROT
MSKSKPVRLDKLLANMGYGTRKEIDALVRSRRILLEGKPLKSASEKLPPSENLQNRLTIDNTPIDPLPGFAIMLHKPVGVTCSRKDSGTLINELFPSRWDKRDPLLSPIGRLDKDTSGLLLLTDDGQLNHRVSSPKTETPKRYHVILDRDLKGDEVEIFAAGTLMLESEHKPLLPAEMEVISSREAILTLHEGRYHQVRRMFAAQGNHVNALHRLSIGGLHLPEDLKAGQWRFMSNEDINTIFSPLT